MVLLTVACYSALLFFYVPLPGAHAMHDDAFQHHVAGMWLGFLLSAGLIAWFAVRMADTRRERDRLASEMREQALRHERVLALGTQAAGAAHELGTPLSTLAVLLKDARPEEALGERRLATLREQIGRCKSILSSLTADAGAARAEGGTAVALDRWLTDILEKWRAMRPDASVHPDLSGHEPAPRVFAEQTLAQAVTSLLNNAADASPQAVEMRARWTTDELTLEIGDRGPGLSPSVRDRLGQAFLSTKDEGLGLGLFLAQTTVQRLGGALTIQAREGGGTCCRLTLPLAALRLSGS
jgi:two-component system sensor histidine kinase RegB